MKQEATRQLPGYPVGVDLVKHYKEKRGGTSVLGFSRGKDSIATALAIRDHLDVYPVYFYAVPGLSFIEESLEYYSKVLFNGRRIIKFPESSFFKWLAKHHFQTPHTAAVLDACDLDTTISIYQWWRDTTEWVIEQEKLPDTTLAATGVRARDSPYRWLNVQKHGPIRLNAKNWLPIWDYRLADVESVIRKAGVKLPMDYRLFGRSFGGGVDARFLIPIKKHLPEDWQVILKWFPLAELEVWKYERFIEKA